MASKAHNETDGQSERSIKTLIEILRTVIQTKPIEWDLLLPEIEFELKLYKKETTHKSPFEVDLGRNPSSLYKRASKELVGKEETAWDDIERQKKYLKVARDHMEASKESQQFYANEK